VFATDFKALGKNKWILALGVFGAVLLLFGSMFNSTGKSIVGTVAGTQGQNQTPNGQGQGAVSGTGTEAQQLASAYESQYDKQLENILVKIDGINQVNVMVTVDSTEILKLASSDSQTNSTQKNGQTASTSTTTNQQIFTIRNQDGSQTPVVIERVQPQIRGVLVTVAAKDFTLAKSEIIDAIQNVLDVPAYKISVEPQGMGE
jgi:stage III sporulation protein AG